MPPLFASKSPFFVPVRQKFSHPVHGLPHFSLWQAALLFAEMFCRTGASSLCCCTSVLCFADEKSFPQKCGIQSVKGRSLFPHVENSVKKVQKSCFKACFTDGNCKADSISLLLQPNCVRTAFFCPVFRYFLIQIYIS